MTPEESAMLGNVAKAAGWTGFKRLSGYWLVESPSGENFHCCEHWDYPEGRDPYFGDAVYEAGYDPRYDELQMLELAVKLDLIIMPYPQDEAVRVTRIDQPETIVYWRDCTSKLMATMLAVFRAAALIGAPMSLEKLCKVCNGRGWIFMGHGEDRQCEACSDHQQKGE